MENLTAQRKAEFLSIIVSLVENHDDKYLGEVAYKNEVVAPILELAKAVGINIVKTEDVYEHDLAKDWHHNDLSKRGKCVGAYLRFEE